MALKYSSISSSGGTGFNVQIGSKYSYATFTQALPAGAYTIKSSNNYTNWDVYLLDASNNLVAYTGTASIAPVSAFSAIVVVNGTVNDILQFSYQTTVFSTAETTQTNAGPFITAATPTSLPNQNNTITVTGGNFASGITATFTGSDLVQRTAKAVIYNSATSLTITRPDSMPVAYAPYTLTLGNPGINNPTTSNAHTFGNITVGVNPVWVTSLQNYLYVQNSAFSLTLSATDADNGSTVTYSYVSGSLPAGLSFNSTTGVISGTPTATSSTTYTVRATDSGGNTTDKTFTFASALTAGGTVFSDSSYFYHAFTNNGTFTTGSLPLTVDVLTIAGGGAGGSGSRGAAGGAGGLVYSSSVAVTANSSQTVTVGAGGAVGAWNDSNIAGGSVSGNPSQFGSQTQAVGGGRGGSYDSGGQATGGSGGGGWYVNPGAAGTSGQGNAGGAGYSSPNYGGGGGGGAGQAGSQGTSTTGGKGGDGVSTYSSWGAATGYGQNISGTYWFSGGGSADLYGPYATNPGVPGQGGGGTGRNPSGTQNSACNGQDYTGGGGGSNGSGGKGIVIVRYARAS